MFSKSVEIPSNENLWNTVGIPHELLFKVALATPERVISEAMSVFIRELYKYLPKEQKKIWIYYWNEELWTYAPSNDILNKFIYKIKKNKKGYYLHAFLDVDLAVEVIKKYWKKYRYNVFKKRRDPLKRELVEYLFHPSRIDFNV